MKASLYSDTLKAFILKQGTDGIPVGGYPFGRPGAS
jgi:hypothetical protein